MARDYETAYARLPSLSGTSAIFEIFRDQRGHWCARSVDGFLFGIFIKRDDAVRFARRECSNAATLVLFVESGDKMIPHQKKAA